MPGRGRPQISWGGVPGDPRGMEALAASYLEWLGVHGYSPRTQWTSKHLLRLFAVWCAERGIVRPSEVSRLVIERYQRHLYHVRREHEKPLSMRTQNLRLAILKSFFKWLARERYLLHNPASEIELPRYNRRLPADTLTSSQVETLLAQPDVATPLGLRDRAILEVFYATGMRRMELQGLDLYDLDLERGWIVIRKAKGGKERVVPAGERALAWTRRYLEAIRSSLLVRPDEPALFVTAYGERFGAERLTILVRNYVKQAELPHHGACHLLRHACATLMLEGGADIRYVQEMLGHAKLDTTQIYTHVSIQKLAEIHTATHPGARLSRASATSKRAELLVELDAEAVEDGDV